MLLQGTDPNLGALEAPFPPMIGFIREEEVTDVTHAHSGTPGPKTSMTTLGSIFMVWPAAGCPGKEKVLEPRVVHALRNLKNVQLAGVLECLAPIAEPDPHYFPVIVEFLSDLSDLLASGQWVLLEVGIESLNGLWGKGGAALAFFGGLPPNKLHQVLLAFLVPEFSFIQPLLQHWL